LAKSINMDDVIADMLASIGDNTPPSREDGWVTLNDMLLQAKGKSVNQIRTLANRMADAGAWEKIIWNKLVYYRKVK
jgi:hypothetical protein